MNKFPVRLTILWHHVCDRARHLEPWFSKLRAWLEPARQWLLRLSERYHAQQEVIKRQSEVSHERITLKRAVLTFMETWGLGSRNIFYTAWHLLWRPGYVIADYLNGRRNRYMQPFFMFFVLTLILVQLAWIINVQTPKNKDMTLIAFELLRDHKDAFTPEQSAKIINAAQWLDKVQDWCDENRAWDLLLHSIGVLIVTWLLWRKSPRVGEAEWIVESGELLVGYNFAEIATAVVYILCQLQLISMITLVLFHRLPFDHMQGWAMVMPKLVLFGILLVDFKQLFRREWWPTVWRTMVIVVFA